MPVDADAFHDVLFIEWKHNERAEVVELRALIAGVRWLLRKQSRLRKRQLFLLDSRVVLGASKKGRSNSPALAFLMKRLAAMLLISGTLPHFLYIPTEYNPADAPSRGYKRHRFRPMRKVKSKFDNCMRDTYHRRPLHRS